MNFNTNVELLVIISELLVLLLNCSPAYRFYLLVDSDIVKVGSVLDVAISL